MSRHDLRPASRRRVLQFLATGQLLTAGPLAAFAQGLPTRPPDPAIWASRDPDNVITDPKQALDVFDFEPVAKKNLPPAHFGVMVTGADDEVTLRANREGFLKFQLRPRRLVDVSTIDMTTELFGARYDSPIVIAPTGGNRAFHPDGEIAVAKAAKAGNHLQILSTGASTSIEDAITARGAPIWFQLYPTNKWEVAEALVRRAERAGSPVIALTIDTLSQANWETLARLRRSDTRNCAAAPEDETHARTRARPAPRTGIIRSSSVRRGDCVGLTAHSFETHAHARETGIMYGDNRADERAARRLRGRCGS